MGILTHIHRYLYPFKRKRVSKTSEIATSPMYIVGAWLSNQYLYDTSSYIETHRHRVFQQMSNSNPDVKAALLLKKLAVLSNGWQLNYEDTNEGGQKRQGDFVRDVLESLPNGFNPVIEHILDAIKFGYSLQEKVYAPIESGDWAGMLGYKVIRDKPIYDFVINTNEHGEITEFVQNQEDDGGIAIPPWKLVYYAYQGSSDNPYGVSDLCPAFQHVFAQAVVDESWPAALKRYAMPIILAETHTSQNMPPEKQNELIDRLKKLREETGILLDAQLKDVRYLEQGSSQASYGNYERHQRYRSQQIRRSVLVPDLVMSEGDRSGSWALGGIHEHVLVALTIQQIRMSSAWVINSQIIKPLVDMNFNDVEVYPEFCYGSVDQIEMKQLAETISSFIDKGIVEPKMDRDWIREKFDFPPVAELDNATKMEPTTEEEEMDDDE